MIEDEMCEDTSVIQLIINDLKASSPIWEDFVAKGAKLHASLRATAATLEAFLDSMLRVADAATGSKGASKDVGASLTKMVLRHRNIEQKLRVLAGLFGDSLVLPLQEKIDEWKKSVNQFDKDNTKEFKKAKQDLKRVNSETLRLHNKVNKKGKFAQKERLEAVKKMATAQTGVFEEHQKRALRKVLVEERSRYCILLNFLQPVVEQEVSLLSDAESLASLLQEASSQCEKPSVLPAAGEHMIEEFKSPEIALLDEQITPPASPTNQRRHANTVSSGTSSRSNSPPSRVASPENRTLSRSKSMSAASNKPAPPVRRSSVLSPTREGYMDKHLGTSRLSVSSTQSSTSNNSNYSSMSSLHDSSQYVDYLPPPPPATSNQPQNIRPPSYGGDDNLPPPPVEALLRGRSGDTVRTIDSGFYSSVSSSLDRSPSASLAQVPYDDNDSGHYEAVNDGSSEGLYEYTGESYTNYTKTHRSHSESLGIRGHHPLAKRSISFNDSETAIHDWSDMTADKLRKLGVQESAVKGVNTSELSAQIAANAAEVAAHFQRKEESQSPTEKWRPPVAKKNFFSPAGGSPDFGETSKQMEMPRQGVDNEFLDESYKLTDPSASGAPQSFLSQIQRQRSSMKYKSKPQTR